VLVVSAAYLLPRLWSDTLGYTLVAEHEIDLPSFEELALSPDGGTVYLKGPETPVLAVDSRTGESLFTSEQAGRGGISVSPDGAFLAVHGSNSVSRLREPENNRDPVLVLDAEDGRTLVETAAGARGGDTAFTPEGRLVVTSVWGGTALWDVRSGTRISAISRTGGEDLAEYLAQQGRGELAADFGAEPGEHLARRSDRDARYPVHHQHRPGGDRGVGQG
jgi:WD40 repeat protein